MDGSPKAVEQWLKKKLDTPALLEWTANLLLRLCAVNTSITSDIERMRRAEKKCFEICAEQLSSITRSISVKMQPIAVESIKNDPDYTIPYYAEHLRHDPESVYRGRCGMLVSIGDENSGTGANRWILNAHIDTVPPYIAPRKTDDVIIQGRGTADNKGGVAVGILVYRLLAEAVLEKIISRMPPLDLLFVSDEESGGNGSLAALSHLETANGPVVVLEPTNLKPHPANRGALWFKLQISAGNDKTQGLPLLAMAHVVKALNAAGLEIKSQSVHPLFSKEDVQTCFGILGGYGTHPSSACAELVIEVQTDGLSVSTQELEKCTMSSFEEAVAVGELKDKTGLPVLEAGHAGKNFWRLKFRSTGGHMGSAARDSDAILKAAATIIRMKEKEKLFFYLLGHPQTIILEGGQGFLPDHTLEDVKERISTAVESALYHFRVAHSLGASQLNAELCFDKLHNRAYCSDKSNGAPLLANALGQLTGIEPTPIRGWQASCDARLFAKKFDDVITFGAGRLQDAHQDHEQIYVPDIMTAAAAVTLAILASRNKPL